MDTMPEPRSARTTVKRGKNRAEYRDQEMREILSAGLIAHVGVNLPTGPMVLPMVYGVRGDEILIHGGIANAMMRGSRFIDVCLTITILDGLVVARTPFSNSVNYRSVVIRGEATVIEESAEKLKALKVINDHMVEIWDSARYPNEEENRITMVLSVPLDEMSAKVRTGGPNDSDEDIETDAWAGVIPLATTWGAPESASNLRDGITVPAVIQALERTDAHA